MDFEKTTIYTLSDPETEVIRYVGKTRQYPPMRLYQHIMFARRGKTPKDRWLQGLLSRKLQPIFTIIEQCPHDDGPAAEAKWIAFYLESGVAILNVMSTPDKVKARDEKRAARKAKWEKYWADFEEHLRIHQEHDKRRAERAASRKIK